MSHYPYRLDEITRVLKKHHLNRPKATVVTVGGTNGKGTAVRFMERCLIQNGIRVGCFTSPHLFHESERIRLDGVPIAESLLKKYHEVYSDDLEHLSYFERFLLIAMVFFAEKSVEAIVLEVGMGGRLDATNAIDSDAAVITSIDLDHTEALGDTREAIAIEKLGISRPGKPLIVAESNWPKVCLDGHQSKVIRVGHDFHDRDEDNLWIWWDQKDRIEMPRNHHPKPSISGAVYVLLRIFCVKKVSIQNTLRNFQNPGRYQRESVNGKEIIWDVAHNNAALLWLGKQLRSDHRENITLVFWSKPNKNIFDGLTDLLLLSTQCFFWDRDGDGCADKCISFLQKNNKFVQYQKASLKNLVNEVKNSKMKTWVITGSFDTVSTLKEALNASS